MNGFSLFQNETRGPPLVKSPSVSSDGTKAKRSNSYIGAINQAIRDDMNKCNVGAGLQRVVQVSHRLWLGEIGKLL